VARQSAIFHDSVSDWHASAATLEGTSRLVPVEANDPERTFRSRRVVGGKQERPKALTTLAVIAGPVRR